MELAPDCPAEEVAKWLETEDTARLSVFLRNRHQARFFGPIECLQTASNTHGGYGFSMMALCCLLVETIQCYREGMPSTSEREWRELVSIQNNELVPRNYRLQENIPKNGWQVFERFFLDFQIFFPNVNGPDFYRNIRNGLLHQAQTKDGWTIDTLGSVVCDPAPKKHINRNFFAQALRDTFERYIKDLAVKDWNDPEAEMTLVNWSDKGNSLDNLGYLKEACVCYERAVSISPNQAIVWMNYAGVLWELGRLDEALACVDRGLAIDSSVPGLWKNKEAILKSMNRPVEARACLEKLLELQSNDGSSFAMRDLAITLYNDGDLESALKCCDAGLASNRRYADLWFGKALILVQMGKCEEALTSCQEGLAVEPRNHKLWSIQANALRNLGRLEEALLACDRGLEIKPDHVELWYSKAFVMLGLRHFEQALVACKEGLALEPRNPNFWSLQANTLRKLGRLEEALAACNQGLKIKPSDSVLLEINGLTLISLGNKEEGETYLKIAQVLKD